jgi:hypothetical protein
MLKPVNTSNKWKAIVEKLGIDTSKAQGRERLAWMSEMANIQEMKGRRLNENGIAQVNMSTIQGMGAVSPSFPGAVPGQPGTFGSGDFGQNLVPVAMKIAAQTIGLDLVSVKPAAGPRIDLAYLDYRYDDNNFNRAQEKPQLFQVPAYPALLAYLSAAKAATTNPEGRVFVTVSIAPDAASATPIAASALSVEKVAKSNISNPFVNSLSAMANTDTYELEFVGYTRIEGNPVFRVYRQVNNATSGSTTAFGFSANDNSFPANLRVGEALGAYIDGTTPANSRVAFLAPVTAPPVPALGTAVAIVNPTLQVVDATTPAQPSHVSVMEDNFEGFVNNWNKFAMPREQDDDFYPGIIAPDLKVRSVQIGSIEVSAAVKQNEIEDIKAATGIDIIQKLEGVLVNELSQAISKEIVANWKRLSARGRETAPRVAGVFPQMKGGFKTQFDFDVDQFAAGAPSGTILRTSFSDLQRKLVAKIERAAAFIVREGRIGRPTHIVTNSKLASVLVDNATNMLNPYESNLTANGNQLYPVGTVKGMVLYVDPYQADNDNSLYLGRKNNVDQPGLIFVPYLMAQSLSIMSEQTRTPRLFLRSRYSVVELGFFPFKQFMEINVNDPEEILL